MQNDKNNIKEQSEADINILRNFYNEFVKLKTTDDADDKNVDFILHSDFNRIKSTKFKFNKKCGNLIQADDNDVKTIDLKLDPALVCIGGFFIMLSKKKDGKTNVYALNNNCINKIDNNPVDINANAQDIKPHVFKIKNVPIENARKFLSSFVDNTEPKDVNNYAKQVKNELDFKCVFSEIVNNDNENDIVEIVNNNHKQLDVIKNIRDGYNNVIKNIKDKDNQIYPNKGNQMFFKGFDHEDVKLCYNINTGSVSNDLQTRELEQNAYYFGRHGLLMAITKNNNGKVNVFATNANMKDGNPDGGNDEYAGLFAVYDASKEDAKRFIQTLDLYYIDKADCTNINSQEKFEQFFQEHCKKNEIKIEDEKVDTGCCLFNLCGCGNQQNVVN